MSKKKLSQEIAFQGLFFKFIDDYGLQNNTQNTIKHQKNIFKQQMILKKYINHYIKNLHCKQNVKSCECNV